MIIKRFKIPLYNYNILFIEIEHEKDSESLLRWLKIASISKEDTEDIINNVSKGVHDGGMAFTNIRKRQGTIFLYKQTSVKEKTNTLSHEKRHLEDRILEEYSIQDIESAAMLSGFLAEKLFI